MEEEKKKTTEDDVRDHLRGFARTIPAFLMAYGDKETTLADFEKNIDEPTFEELTGITVDEFSKLRDGFEYVDDEGRHRKVPGLFNEVVFNASVKEFFAAKERLSNYFDETLTEDIFDYIPPQKTNQIFTPKRVVKMMVDMLEKVNPGLFKDYNTKFLDPYAKSGLYITEIVKRLYKGLAEQIPEPGNRIRWILENQVYAIAPSNIIHNIVKNYVYPDGLEISTKNLVELDLSAFWDDALWQNRIIDAFGGDEDMKFDVIIGNPPYQEMDGGAQASARPLYHKFIQRAKDLEPSLISFIIPTRWYVGGKGLDEFREHMLSDKHLRELHDWLTPDDIFPNTNIRGGVCYFLWDRDYDNNERLTRVVTYQDNAVVDDVTRPMAIEGSDIFIRDSKAFSILGKISGDDFESLQHHVSPRKPFGLEGYVSRGERFHAESGGLSDPIQCYAKGMAVGYVERGDVAVRSEWIDKWKVFTPRANNIGTELNDDNLNTFVGAPGTVCTESYIVIGGDLGLDEESVENLSKYLTTKFVRYLHGLAKASHDATAKTYRFIPLQDFSNQSDIDWSLSVREVDEQLFDKYDLAEEERQHIDKVIKDMENC